MSSGHAQHGGDSLLILLIINLRRKTTLFSRHKSIFTLKNLREMFARMCFKEVSWGMRIYSAHYLLFAL